MTLFAHLDPDEYILPDELRERLLSPALVIWMEKVRHNIATVVELCGSANRWRPHVKTTKMPPVWHELLDAGVRRFKTSTTRETARLCETLDEAGLAGDVLLAQPLVHPALRRLQQIAAAHPSQRLSVLVEDGARLSQIPRNLDVFVDINPGMDRTGLPLTRRTELIGLCLASAERLAGLHFYDGHLHGSDLARREQAIHAGYDELLTLLPELKAAGCRVGEIISAGTPAFTAALSHPGLAALEGTRHTVSPGTVVFHDARSEAETPGLGLLPAATVFSRVLSHPAPGRVTADAGHKALAADMGDPCARVLGHPQWLPASPSEEHLPLVIGDGDLPPRGATLQLIPEHVCPTVNLAERAVLIEPDGSWRVADVAARAHELLCDH